MYILVIHEIILFLAFSLFIFFYLVCTSHFPYTKALSPYFVANSPGQLVHNERPSCSGQSRIPENNLEWFS